MFFPYAFRIVFFYSVCVSCVPCVKMKDFGLECGGASISKNMLISKGIPLISKGNHEISKGNPKISKEIL